MTKEVLDKLNVTMRQTVEQYKAEYKNDYLRNEARHKARAYTQALQHCDFLTRREAQALFLYVTI